MYMDSFDLFDSLYNEEDDFNEEDFDDYEDFANFDDLEDIDDKIICDECGSEFYDEVACPYCGYKVLF